MKLSEMPTRRRETSDERRERLADEYYNTARTAVSEHLCYKPSAYIDFLFNTLDYNEVSDLLVKLVLYAKNNGDYLPGSDEMMYYTEELRRLTNELEQKAINKIVNEAIDLGVDVMKSAWL